MGGGDLLSTESCMEDKKETHGLICHFLASKHLTPLPNDTFNCFGEICLPHLWDCQKQSTIFLRKAHTWASGVFCTQPLFFITKGSADHLLLTCWTLSQDFTCWVSSFLDVKRSNVWSLVPALWLCCHIQKVIVLYSCIISCSCFRLSHGISGDSFHIEVNQNHFYRIWPKHTGWATWIIGNQICVCLCRSSAWHWESENICCSKTINEWICSMTCHR